MLSLTTAVNAFAGRRNGRPRARILDERAGERVHCGGERQHGSSEGSDNNGARPSAGDTDEMKIGSRAKVSL